MHLSWFILFGFLSLTTAISLNKFQQRNNDKEETNPEEEYKRQDDDEVIGVTEAHFAVMEAAALEVAEPKLSTTESPETELEKLKQFFKSLDLNKEKCQQEKDSKMKIPEREDLFGVTEKNIDEKHPEYPEPFFNKTQTDLNSTNYMDINSDFFQKLQKEIYENVVKGAHKENNIEADERPFETVQTDLAVGEKTNQIPFNKSFDDSVSLNNLEEKQVNGELQSFAHKILMTLKHLPNKGKDRWLVATQTGRMAASIAAEASRDAANEAADTALSASVALKSPFASDELKKAAMKVLAENKEKASNFLMASRKADAAAAFLHSSLSRVADKKPLLKADDQEMVPRGLLGDVIDIVDFIFGVDTGNVYYNIYDYDVDSDYSIRHKMDPNYAILD